MLGPPGECYKKNRNIWDYGDIVKKKKEYFIFKEVKIGFLEEGL